MRRDDLRQAGEIAAVRGENSFIKTQFAQPRLGLRQLQRVLIQTQQFSAGRNSCQNFLRVTAVTERAIHGEVAGLRRKHLQNFRDHDGPVRADGRLAGGDDLGDGRGVAAVFLVFVCETARIAAAVAHAAFVRCRRDGSCFGHVAESIAGLMFSVMRRFAKNSRC